jgi:lipoprotein-anchoring transpeptidase ErfK/SrfK
MRWNIHAAVAAAALAGCLSAATAQTGPDALQAGTNTASAAGRRFREIVAAQTVLDRHNLSGGRIDGVIGSRTRAAIGVWQASRGMPVTERLDRSTLESILAGAENVLAIRKITADDYAELSAVPVTWAEKATMARLGYETILEMLAESYHASEETLRKLNPQAEWPDPPAGAAVVVPNPFPAAPAQVQGIAISLSGKWVRAYDNAGNIVAHFPCSIAADKSKRPVGELRVTVAASEPNYTFNPELFPEYPESRTLQGRKLIIAPGPNNPVGSAWIGLNMTGYGMHGTPRPGDIGNTESHGCFRLANWNAVKLLKMVRPDMPVNVIE